MIDSSSKESPQTALKERKRILSIMRKKGFKLSKDGSSWVPLEEAENNTNRIILPNEENESSTLGALTPFLFICALFSLVAGFDTSPVEGPFACCCLFLALGCIGMLANSEGRVGETILILMVILFFFGIVFMIILDSMMSGGWGGMGVGGLSGWGGP